MPWPVAAAVAHLPLIIKGGYRGSLVFRATVADEIAAMEALGWCGLGDHNSNRRKMKAREHVQGASSQRLSPVSEPCRYSLLIL